jgi:hypothetical protein
MSVLPEVEAGLESGPSPPELGQGSHWLNNGRYRLSVVPHGEIPLHLLGLMATGSFDGIS